MSCLLVCVAIFISLAVLTEVRSITLEVILAA